LSSNEEKPIPPASEIFTAAGIVARHPHLLSKNRLTWISRNRKKNGLKESGVVYESPTGKLLFHEPSLIEWMLGLKGRKKPRARRK
jgi:hypothetical protein